MEPRVLTIATTAGLLTASLWAFVDRPPGRDEVLLQAARNSVLADDPQLTARCGATGGMARKQPLRIVVDSRGRTPPAARVFSKPGKALLAVGRFIESDKREAFAKAGAELLELPLEEGLVDFEL